MHLPILPTINATLNALAGVFLVLGRIAIKNKNSGRHKKMMLCAFICSALFLCAYLYYHLTSRGISHYQGHGLSRVIYFFVLGTHSPLAVLIVPFIIMAIIYALKGDFKKHTRITRWLYPAWGYVSLTGVIVYLMLYVFPVVCFAQSGDNIELGYQLYLKYGCAVCHGKEGYGNGPAAKNLYYLPTNFHDLISYRAGTSRGQMKDVIRHGLREEDSIMPSFGHIPDQEQDRIVGFLLSLQEHNHEDVVVSHAWVMAMPPSSQTTAAFMEIENTTGQDTKLVAVSSPAARSVEMHTMSQSAGMMKMQRVKEIRIPAHGKVLLAHGGYHLMVIDLLKPLKKEQTVPFVLQFQYGTKMNVNAIVRDDES
ncbi:MAG: DUF420 domain-containing protein [Candidatus Omnitrophica bacterium]|nr:DUF420 domain-containing protein [Candidatus Omnitrophota bacterium]